MTTAAKTQLANAREAAAVGMLIAFTAAKVPDRPAILSERGSRTFAELNARANRLARALRERGLGEGDAIALVCSNRPEFAEVWAAAIRIGLRLTPLNWHLSADETAYVVDDEATAGRNSDKSDLPIGASPGGA